MKSKITTPSSDENMVKYNFTTGKKVTIKSKANKDKEVPSSSYNKDLKEYSINSFFRFIGEKIKESAPKRNYLFLRHCIGMMAINPLILNYIGAELISQEYRFGLTIIFGHIIYKLIEGIFSSPYLIMYQEGHITFDQYICSEIKETYNNSKRQVAIKEEIIIGIEHFLAAYLGARFAKYILYSYAVIIIGGLAEMSKRVMKKARRLNWQNTYNSLSIKQVPYIVSFCSLGFILGVIRKSSELSIGRYVSFTKEQMWILTVLIREYAEPFVAIVTKLIEPKTPDLNKAKMN